jgi:hypothetical protein
MHLASLGASAFSSCYIHGGIEQLCEYYSKRLKLIAWDNLCNTKPTLTKTIHIYVLV